MRFPMGELMAQIRSAILAFARNLFARETLPPAPPPEPLRRTGPGLATFLLAPEALPEDPVRPSRPRRTILPLLFAPEPLPQEAEAPPRGRGRGVLSLLFAPEPLGQEEEAAARPRRRGRWLEWLFKPENLDPS